MPLRRAAAACSRRAKYKNATGSSTTTGGDLPPQPHRPALPLSTPHHLSMPSGSPCITPHVHKPHAATWGVMTCQRRGRSPCVTPKIWHTRTHTCMPCAAGRSGATPFAPHVHAAPRQHHQTQRKTIQYSTDNDPVLGHAIVARHGRCAAAALECPHACCTHTRHHACRAVPRLPCMPAAMGNTLMRACIPSPPTIKNIPLELTSTPRIPPCCWQTSDLIRGHRRRLYHLGHPVW